MPRHLGTPSPQQAKGGDEGRHAVRRRDHRETAYRGWTGSGQQGGAQQIGRR
jgi:hypothetical protein